MYQRAASLQGAQIREAENYMPPSGKGADVNGLLILFSIHTHVLSDRQCAQAYAVHACTQDRRPKLTFWVWFQGHCHRSSCGGGQSASVHRISLKGEWKGIINMCVSVSRRETTRAYCVHVANAEVQSEACARGMHTYFSRNYLTNIKMQKSDAAVSAFWCQRAFRAMRNSPLF